MSQSLIKTTSLKDLVTQPAVKDRLREIMGDRGNQFAVALVNICRNSQSLAKCKPETVLGSAFQAAALDLSVDPNIGEAHLVPYGDVCSLQVGYLGLSQLALRSGQYKNLGWAVVHEGELESWDELSGELVVVKDKKVSEKVIGYAAKFRLLNGFERGFYMTVEEVEAHAKRFSQSFRKGTGPWKEYPERMGLKTVLKMLLKLWGPKSIQMQKALVVDEGVVSDGGDVVYPDNDMPAGVSKPEFVTVESSPATETACAAPTPPPEPPKAPEPAKTPPKAPEAPEVKPEAKEYNVVKALNGLCALHKVTKEEVLASLRDVTGSDASSFEQFLVESPDIVQALHDDFTDFVARMKGQNQ